MFIADAKHSWAIGKFALVAVLTVQISMIAFIFVPWLKGPIETYKFLTVEYVFNVFLISSVSSVGFLMLALGMLSRKEKKFTTSIASFSLPWGEFPQQKFISSDPSLPIAEGAEEQEQSYAQRWVKKLPKCSAQQHNLSIIEEVSEAESSRFEETQLSVGPSTATFPVSCEKTGQRKYLNSLNQLDAEQRIANEPQRPPKKITETNGIKHPAFLWTASDSNFLAGIQAQAIEKMSLTSDSRTESSSNNSVSPRSTQVGVAVKASEWDSVSAAEKVGDLQTFCSSGSCYNEETMEGFENENNEIGFFSPSKELFDKLCQQPMEEGNTNVWQKYGLLRELYFRKPVSFIQNLKNKINLQTHGNKPAYSKLIDSDVNQREELWYADHP